MDKYRIKCSFWVGKTKMLTSSMQEISEDEFKPSDLKKLVESGHAVKIEPAEKKTKSKPVKQKPDDSKKD